MTTPKFSVVHIPFMLSPWGGNDRIIKDQLAEAPLRVPGAKRYEYTPPQPYELDGETHYTEPEITAYFV